MSAPDLDPLFSPTRLRIAAYLSGCESADYSAVQEALSLTKPTLSKSLTLLDQRGYIEIGKIRQGRYTKTTLALTTAGGRALAAHLRALQAIAAQAAARD